MLFPLLVSLCVSLSVDEMKGKGLDFISTIKLQFNEILEEIVAFLKWLFNWIKETALRVWVLIVAFCSQVSASAIEGVRRLTGVIEETKEKLIPNKEL